MLRSFDHYDFDAARLVERKAGQRISVCLPARNEEATVGEIVASIKEHLIERCPLVDELLVVDDHSSDETARRASDAGAVVVDAESVLPEQGGGAWKGRGAVAVAPRVHR